VVDTLLAGCTVASPQAGPLLNVPPAPATVEDSRLAWRRFRGFSDQLRIAAK